MAVAETAAGRLPASGRWAAERPTDWNGTLLLWSRGYGSGAGDVQTAPRGTRDWLLAHGYAIAGADYSAPGWALEDAVPDQLATLKAFGDKFGRPKRVIAWGGSMGGLITVALAERHPDRFAGAMPSCASIGGSIGMMNMALDGAFAFKTLLAPDSDIKLVGIDDDRRNSERVRKVLDEAGATPAGRARIALAATLAGLPTWSDTEAAAPADSDYAEQQRQAQKAFLFGVFFPRTDQEQRAGGAFSWNEGVDYAAQLRRSGREPAIAAIYKRAGLDLAADLRKLAAAPRIKADPLAVAYMRDNYVPSGVLRTPVLAYQTIGDGATSPRLQASYAETVKGAGYQQMLGTAWINRAGHCTFSAGEHIAALKALESRIDSGRWSLAPATLNAGADAAAPGSGRFIAYRAQPALRPCTASEKVCR